MVPGVAYNTLKPGGRGPRPTALSRSGAVSPFAMASSVTSEKVTLAAADGVVIGMDKAAAKSSV